MSCDSKRCNQMCKGGGCKMSCSSRAEKCYQMCHVGDCDLKCNAKRCYRRCTESKCTSSHAIALAEARQRTSPKECNTFSQEACQQRCLNKEGCDLICKSATSYNSCMQKCPHGKCAVECKVNNDCTQHCHQGKCKSMTCDSKYCSQICHGSHCNMKCNAERCQQICNGRGCVMKCPRRSKTCQQICRGGACAFKRLTVMEGSACVRVKEVVVWAKDHRISALSSTRVHRAKDNAVTQPFLLMQIKLYLLVYFLFEAIVDTYRCPLNWFCINMLSNWFKGFCTTFSSQSEKEPKPFDIFTHSWEGEGAATCACWECLIG